MKVGTIVKLQLACLGNEVGTRGVVYDEYNIGTKGVSVIFENGEYDGFSEEEQRMFLKEKGICEELSTYKFTNVMQLSRDFDNGIFDNALKGVKNYG